MKKFLKGLGAIALLGGLLSTSVPALAETIVVAVGAPKNSLQGRSAEKFATDLQARLGSGYKVEFYSDAQLGNEKELMQKLRLGTVQFTLISSIMTTVANEFALFDLPFLVQDRAHMKRIDQEIVQGVLLPKAQAKGLHVVSTWENGFRQITNSIRPITTPADLAGIKIRTPSSEWRVAMFKEYGANPTAMAFSELFVALQTGTMDGQENPLTNIVGANLHEVQKYLSLSGHVYTPTYLTTGSDAWNKMPADVKKTVSEVANNVQDWAFAEGEKADRELIDKVVAAGVAVNQTDKAAFVAASAPIYDLFNQKVPGAGEMIQKARALAK